MGTLFLLGGGWEPEAFPLTYGRFISAATYGNHRKILLILAEETDEGKKTTGQKYQSLFQSLQVSSHEMKICFVSDRRPLNKDILIQYQPTGIFVGGGLTPLYHQGLCLDREWLDYVQSQKIPYGGFSAGAAIAPEQAIVGGWKLPLNTHEIPILDSDLGEDLDYLSVRKGLGLVSFSVDVHASQWGTLTRLIHAVDQGLIKTGWAIDENTMLQVAQGEVRVFGLGQAYHVKRIGEGKLGVEILRGSESNTGDQSKII